MWFFYSVQGSPRESWGVRVRRGPDLFLSPPLHHGGLLIGLCAILPVRLHRGKTPVSSIPDMSQRRGRGCRAGEELPGEAMSSHSCLLTHSFANL